jgi:hypothetical protein
VGHRQNQRPLTAPHGPPRHCWCRPSKPSSVTVIVFEHLLANSNRSTTNNKVQGASALGGGLGGAYSHHAQVCRQAHVHASEAVHRGHSTPDDGSQAVQPRMGVLQKVHGVQHQGADGKSSGAKPDRALGAAPV